MEVVIGAVVGAALVLAAPRLCLAVQEAARPLAKELIKGGLLLYEAMNDLVAEAKAEIAQAKQEGGVEAERKG
ncbi:hypothetical protein [Nitrospira sp. Kam-Ns4a]